MNRQVVTLTGFEEKKTGTNDRGPWALRVFTAAGGTKYQTFDVHLGDKLIGLLNTPVEIEYDVKPNGKYENNVLKGVKEAGGVSDQVAQQLLAAGAQPWPPVDKDAERQLRIMRQSGLDRAINTVKAGIVEVDSVADLFRLSDAYIDYFENGVPAQEEAEVY